MVDKVPFDITAQDKSAAGFASFTRRAEGAFASAQKASGRFGAFLAGGGVSLGFRAVYRVLDEVAEKFKTTSAASRAFIAAGENIGAVYNNRVLSVLEAIKPAIDAFNSVMSQTARQQREVESTTDLLAIRQRELNEAVENGASLESAYGRALVARRDAAQQAANKAQADAAGKNGPIQLPGFADQNTWNKIKAAETERREKAEKAAADQAKTADQQAKQAADSLAKYNEDLVAKRIENEQAATDRANAYNEEVVQARAARQEAAYEAAEKAAADAETDRLKTIQEQAQSFGELFASNLIQSGETGFKGLLQQWEKTIIQMIAIAQAKRLFESIFPKGFNSSAEGPGGWVGGVAKFLGFADGGSFQVGGNFGRDANVIPLRLTRGEQVTIAKPGQGGGGVTINQGPFTIGGGASRAEVAAAMAIAKDAAKAEIRNEMRRGR